MLRRKRFVITLKHLLELLNCLWLFMGLYLRHMLQQGQLQALKRLKELLEGMQSIVTGYVGKGWFKKGVFALP